jgi:hypothetical protein
MKRRGRRLLKAAVVAAGEGEDEASDDELKEMMQHRAALLHCVFEAMRVPSEGRKKLHSLRKTFVHRYFAGLFAPGVGV